MVKALVTRVVIKRLEMPVTEVYKRLNNLRAVWRMLAETLAVNDKTSKMVDYCPTVKCVRREVKPHIAAMAILDPWTMHLLGI
jgi:hypothetical protein